MSAGKALSRSERAKEIAAALGIRRVKSDPRCVSCHFTPQELPGERFKAVAEVSCESCHGAARDWIDLHNDFGPDGATEADETEAHRAERHARSDAHGMNRPGRLSSLGRACFGCHVLHDEELVNVGGHPVLDELDLLTWTQGEIRHNFVRGGGENAVADVTRQLRLLAMDAGARLEASSRGLALSTEQQGPYRAGLVVAAASARERLRDMAASSPSPGLARMAQIAETLDLEALSAPDLLAAADELVQALAKLDHEDPADGLEALKSRLPDPSSYRGTPGG